MLKVKAYDPDVKNFISILYTDISDDNILIEIISVDDSVKENPYIDENPSHDEETKSKIKYIQESFAESLILTQKEWERLFHHDSCSEWTISLWQMAAEIYHDYIGNRILTRKQRIGVFILLIGSIWETHHPLITARKYLSVEEILEIQNRFSKRLHEVEGNMP